MNYQAFFFDFDGVLADSVEVKTMAFAKLFERCGPVIVAKEQGLLFFTDDKKARQVAKEQGIEVSGTLGTLKLAVEEGMISIEEADKVLGEMIRGGYRSPIQSMKDWNQRPPLFWLLLTVSWSQTIRGETESFLYLSVSGIC